MTTFCLTLQFHLHLFSTTNQCPNVSFFPSHLQYLVPLPLMKTFHTTPNKQDDAAVRDDLALAL